MIPTAAATGGINRTPEQSKRGDATRSNTARPAFLGALSRRTSYSSSASPGRQVEDLSFHTCRDPSVRPGTRPWPRNHRYPSRRELPAVPVVTGCARRRAPRPRHRHVAVCRAARLLLGHPADLGIRTAISLRSRVRRGDRPHSRLCSSLRTTLVELALSAGGLVDWVFGSLRPFLATALGRALTGREVRSLEVGRTHRCSSTGPWATWASPRRADGDGCILFASKSQKCGKNASACDRLHAAGVPGQRGRSLKRGTRQTRKPDQGQQGGLFSGTRMLLPPAGRTLKDHNACGGR